MIRKYCTTTSKSRELIEIDGDDDENAESLTEQEQLLSQSSLKSLPLSQPKQSVEISNSDPSFNRPKILDGLYFKIIKIKNKDVVAACSICKKELLGSLSSTGNFFSHLKHKHSDILEKCKSYCQSKTKTLNDPNNTKFKNMYQTKLPSCSQLVPGNMVRNLILNYIISEMRPLNTVEKPAFRKMFQGINGNNLIMPCTRTMKNHMTDLYNNSVTNLKNILKKPLYVCTTADAWSCHGVSYLGMTVHFFDDNLKRHSYVLGFEKLTKKHSFDYLARLMYDIHIKFDIAHKITHTVTDGGSNFCKAFKCYSKAENVCVVESSDTDDDDGTEIGEDIAPLKIEFTAQSLTNENIDDDIFLPTQMRCSAHLLNLISSDIQDYFIKNSIQTEKRNNRVVMGKLQAFWNLSRRSDVAKNTIYEESQCQFQVPNATRWNSTFDAIYKIWIKKEKIPIIFDRLKLQKLKLSDWTYIEEYVKLMKPVAQALDILQGEDTVSLGYVLPTVISVKHKIESVTHLSVCNELKKGILYGIEKRFDNILDLNNSESKIFILAAVSHPKFKLSWVPAEHYEMVQKLFVSECISISNHSSSFVGNESETSDDIDKEGFFSDFHNAPQMNHTDCSISQNENQNTKQNYNNIASIQALAYLDKKRSSSLITLNEFPIVKIVFLKYNTTSPSSASVERLFSIALQIFTPRRNRMGAETFKKLLILKGNNNIIH